MRIHLRRATIAVAVLAAALSTTVAASSVAQSPAAACQTPWGTGVKSATGMHTAPLLTTRTGRHPCYDRLVFEFSGTATGYRVGYASNVFTPGQGVGLRPYTAGGKLISVLLRNPAYNAQGSATYRHPVGAHVGGVFGFQTFRDVVYGGSFEGTTVFAVGVRAQLPFRVFHLAGPGAHQRIVLDVAHQG
ncbi:MAG TPA: hypothetical protein VHC49_01430 [Mycobacteriales bacterium]|nr:hypothetical protein [Mycobacteriales bacterium]